MAKAHRSGGYTHKEIATHFGLHGPLSPPKMMMIPSKDLRLLRAAPYRSTRCRRSAFPMTETELRLMAALAIIGLSTRPKYG